MANLSLLYKDKFSARPSHGGGCCPGPLRFIVDLPECTLVPTPSMDVMGIRLNSGACTARLSGDRVGDLLKCVSLFTPRRTLQLRRCLGIPAIVVSAISLVCLGGLHMGPFQRWFRSLHVPTRLVRHRVGRNSGSPFLLLLGAVYALILSKAFSAGGYSRHVECGEVFSCRETTTSTQTTFVRVCFAALTTTGSGGVCVGPSWWGRAHCTCRVVEHAALEEGFRGAFLSAG